MRTVVSGPKVIETIRDARNYLMRHLFRLRASSSLLMAQSNLLPKNPFWRSTVSS